MRRFLRTAFAFLLAGAALPLSPAAAETAPLGELGFVSRHQAVVSATPRDVWLALISPSDWWQAEHTWSGDARNLTLTPQAGGCFCETIPEVDEPGRFTLQGSVEHMRVIQAYPEAAMRLQGALGPLQSEAVTGVLTIVISEADNGTRIVWEYVVGGAMRYDVPVIARAVDGVIGLQLTALAELLGAVETPALGGAVPARSETQADPGPSATPRSEPPEVEAEPAPKGPTVDEAFGDLTIGPEA